MGCLGQDWKQGHQLGDYCSNPGERWWETELSDWRVKEGEMDSRIKRDRASWTWWLPDAESQEYEESGEEFFSAITQGSSPHLFPVGLRVCSDTAMVLAAFSYLQRLPSSPSTLLALGWTHHFLPKSHLHYLGNLAGTPNSSFHLVS